MKTPLAVVALLGANLIHAADFSALQREVLLNYSGNAAWTSAQLHNTQRQLQVAQLQNGATVHAPISGVTPDRKASQLNWWIKQAAYEKNAHAEKFKRNPALAGLDFSNVKTNLQSNTCEQAPLISEGIFQATLNFPDTVWIQIDAPISGTRMVSTVGSEMDTQISVYDSCPGDTDTPIVVNDDDVGLYAQYATTPGARLTKRQWLAIRGDSAGRIQTRISLAGESVSGRVGGAATPQEYVRVVLFHSQGSFLSYVSDTFVQPSTNLYSLPFNAQPTNDYYLWAGNNSGSVNLLPRVYPNAACIQPAVNSPLCDLANATKLTFAEGQQRTGIDITLDAGARIEGRIIGSGVFANAQISAYVLTNGQTNFSRDQYVDQTGRYRLTGLMPNLRYVLRAQADFHQTTMYPNIECQPNFSCNLSLGEAVSPGYYEIRLRRFPFLTINTVPAVETQLAITLYQINAQPNTTYAYGQGSFRALMPAGNSYVSVQAGGYRPVLYGAPSCILNSTGPGCTNFTDGTALSGNEDQQITVALTPLANVSGRVLGGFGAMNVSACRAQNPFSCAYAQVDTTGRFTLSRLEQGNYYIEVSGAEIVDSLYPNVACQLSQNLRCSPELTSAQLVTVGVSDITNIDVTVARTGEISGRLAQNSWSTRLELSKDGLTNDIYGGYFINAGAYTVKDLVPGTYRARTPASSQSFGQVYPSINCTTTCGFNQSQPIEVISGQITPNIDFSPASTVVIAGVVTDARNNVIAFTPVDILRYDSNNVLQREGAVVTDAQGRYRYFTQGFQNGGYVVATDARDHRNMIYQNVLCALGASMYLGTCAATNATTLALPATFPGQFEQINFQLFENTLFGNGFEQDRTR